MARLPNWVQPFITEFTGKPAIGEPATRHTVAGRTLFNMVAQLALAGSAMGLACLLLVTPFGIWTVPVVTLLYLVSVLAGAVVYVVRGVIAHHVAGHKNAREKGWRLVFVQTFVELATIVWLLPSPEAYARSHAAKHHGNLLATKEDPDFVHLIRRGLRPGQTLEWYRRWYRGRSWDLLGLLGDVLEDAWSHLGRAASVRHRILFVTVWMFLGSAALLTGQAAGFALAFALVRMQAARANLVQQISEHTWSRSDPFVPSKDRTLTFHRLVGYELPPRTGLVCQDVFNLVAWVFKMARTVPTRLGAAAADLKHHGRHHDSPRDDWANSAFTAVSAEEVWGSEKEWNEATFKRLSSLPPTLWDGLT